MKNGITGREYTGVNAVTLEQVGVEAVVTFKQAMKVVSGKKLKGIKSCATLVRFDKNETVIDDETGQEKPKPIFFSVFDYAEVLARGGK